VPLEPFGGPNYGAAGALSQWPAGRVPGACCVCIMVGRCREQGLPKPYIHMLYLCYIYTYDMYMQCIYGKFSREIVIHTVIYVVHIRFWPTLAMSVFSVLHIASFGALSWWLARRALRFYMCSCS
jgi:hypothetical protein